VVYTGLDASPQLIALARERADSFVGMKTEFRVVDLADPDWTEPVRGGWFTAVLALAVFQHVPSLALRTQLISQAATLLSPGGALLMSSWQFTSSERMRRKIVSWSDVGIDETELEPGDYLLDWKYGEPGYRYCHLLSEGEILALATAAGLELMETFRADGREGNLNLYAVLSAQGSGSRVGPVEPQERLKGRSAKLQP
jgi:2-polyprenyl-3-methyl-5-hydroxy-6-metoxy-1,4-benzoquinol methylase